MDISAIKPNLMVHAKGKGSMHGIQGVHVGTVDHVEGTNFIKLKKNDSPDRKHHWIPMDWVEKVDAKAVYLKKDKDEVTRGMLDENPAMKH